MAEGPPQASRVNMLIDRVRQALAPQFDIERELGRGGTGLVFLARDPVLDRPVALKVLLPELATAVSVERFIREARILARLRHPSIVSVHQAGQAGEFLYFTMDLVQGETLEARLRRGPLSLPDLYFLARDLLDALAAAHTAGVVHRDVKPGNIFLQGDRALLADFGIAWSESDSTLTLPGMAPGTPAFMAPEQRSGKTATPATDVHAVGLVLYHAATGEHWMEAPQGERRVLRALPRPLRSPVRRALAPQPADRWTDAAAFREAVIRAQRPWRRLLPMAAILAFLGLPAVLWFGRETCGSLQDTWITSTMLPASMAARCTVARAEEHYNQGRWEEAEVEFRAAAEDNSCPLCTYRLLDIERWTVRTRNPAIRELRAAALTAVDQFSPAYRMLIAAEALPNPTRLARLEEITRSHRDFYLPWYLLGEEQYHQGPLFGHTVEEAVVSLQRAIQLRADFAIPWTDLVLAHVSLDDSLAALDASRHLADLAPTTGLALAQRAMAQVAFAFRFGDGDQTASRIVTDPATGGVPEIAAAPRLLPAFGQPDGAVRFGRLLESGDADRRLQLSGLAAQLFGHAALGRPDSMRAAAIRLAQRGTDLSWSRLALGLGQIESAFSSDQVTDGERLIESIARSSPLEGAAENPMFRTLSRAWRAAESGRPADAVAETDTLMQDPDRLGQGDPFLRSLVYLSRAVWFERLGQAGRARRAYRWHRHFHIPLTGFPQSGPVAAEVDWALGTLAEWRLARLLDSTGLPDLELCRALKQVNRLWRGGDSAHQSRAATASDRFTALRCETLT